jgi:hypothetical protein
LVVSLPDRLASPVAVAIGGHEVRPGLTSEPVAWENLHMKPRWIGDDSSGAGAAIEPSLIHKLWGRRMVSLHRPQSALPRTQNDAL